MDEKGKNSEILLQILPSEFSIFLLLIDSVFFLCLNIMKWLKAEKKMKEWEDSLKIEDWRLEQDGDNNEDHGMDCRLWRRESKKGERMDESWEEEG